MNACVKKKALLKTEVIAELDAMKIKYSALDMENKHNLEVIKNLEKKVKDLLEDGDINLNKSYETTDGENLGLIRQLKEKLEKLERETQPGADNEVKCEQCDFEARNKTKLSWHLSDSHGWPLDRHPDDLD